jgi:hypothetical protein
MTTAGLAVGKLDAIGKWSLVIAPILVVVFNFLLPQNGVAPLDPEESAAYITKLGGDADMAQIFHVVILLGIILYTRAIVSLWRAAPEGVARFRLGIGMLGSTAALAMWGLLIGIGLAEASVGADYVKAVAASGGAPVAVTAATFTLTIATALHAAYFGIYQAAIYVAYISLIPLGGGTALSGIVRKEFGWTISLVGLVTVILTSAMPVKTEEGAMIFGVMAVIWGLIFLVMGLQIMRQDMDK